MPKTVGTGKVNIASIKYYDLIQQMCLMDNELMEACFAGHNDCVQLLVRVILNRDDITVIRSEVQKTLKGLGRSVRLDIYAVDDAGKKYNIEIQRGDKGAVPQRARFNASTIDVNTLKPGEDFMHLPEVYVIFITEHDVLGGNLPLYTIDRQIKENGKCFGDGSHIVYVNGENRNADTALGRLLHDLFTSNPDEMNYSPLAERVSYLKREEEGVIEVSGVMDKLLKEQQKTIALKLIECGELALTKIAECTGLSISTVRRMAKNLQAN